MRSQTETAKRYRYIGRERDEETGLAYHGARYYAPWLGRWTSCDPIGIGDGLNVLAYCRCNPVGFTDKHGTQLEPVVKQSKSRTATDLFPLAPPLPSFFNLPQKKGIEISIDPHGIQTIVNYDQRASTQVPAGFDVTSVKLSVGPAIGLKLGKAGEFSLGASAYFSVEKGGDANLGFQASAKAKLFKVPLAGAGLYGQIDIGHKKHARSGGVHANLVNAEVSKDWSSDEKKTQKPADAVTLKIPLKESIPLKEAKTGPQTKPSTPTKTSALSKDAVGVKFVFGAEFGVKRRYRTTWGYSTKTVIPAGVRDATFVYSRYNTGTIYRLIPRR